MTNGQLQFEYLFLDIKWNQPPEMFESEECEPIQISVIATDSTFQKVKIFSRVITKHTDTERNLTQSCLSEEDEIMSKKEGYSRKGLFGTINHYDSNGRKIGESRPSFWGGVNNYDARGNKTGSSRQGIFGGINHYDNSGHKTGSSHQGIFGGINHYDEHGHKKGSSTRGIFGGWNHYDE